MDNEMYDEMDRIVQRIKQIEDRHFGMPGKTLPSKEGDELKQLKARLQELKKKDDKALGLI